MGLRGSVFVCLSPNLGACADPFCEFVVVSSVLGSVGVLSFLCQAFFLRCVGLPAYGLVSLSALVYVAECFSDVLVSTVGALCAAPPAEHSPDVGKRVASAILQVSGIQVSLHSHLAWSRAPALSIHHSLFMYAVSRRGRSARGWRACGCARPPRTATRRRTRARRGDAERELPCLSNSP